MFTSLNHMFPKRLTVTVDLVAHLTVSSRSNVNLIDTPVTSMFDDLLRSRNASHSYCAIFVVTIVNFKLCLHHCISFPCMIISLFCPSRMAQIATGAPVHPSASIMKPVREMKRQSIDIVLTPSAKRVKIMQALGNNLDPVDRWSMSLPKGQRVLVVSRKEGVVRTPAQRNRDRGAPWRKDIPNEWSGNWKLKQKLQLQSSTLP